MRMAWRFSRRVRGWTKKNDLPVIQCKAKQRKHLLAEQYLPEDPDFHGIFLVLVGRAPAPVWEARRSKKTGALAPRRKDPMPWVNQYYFHIMARTITVTSHHRACP